MTEPNKIELAKDHTAEGIIKGGIELLPHKEPEELIDLAQKKPKKQRKLTFKQRAWLKEYIKSQGNGTQSALKTYNTKDINTAAQIGSDNIRNPQIVSLMEQHYNSHGLTKQVFTQIISKKVLDESLVPKDHVKYMQLYVDTTPNVRAPIRSEETKDISIKLEQSKITAIVDLTRQALKEAKT